MMRLLLVPHAETAWNVQGRYQGQTDVPLSERGRHQAERLAERLAAETIDVVFASDLCRAWDTAIRIAAPRGLSPRQEPRLRELHFGAWEGLTFAEVQRLGKETPPGGETLADLAARLRSFLDDLAPTHRDGEQTMLLVAHRGSLRVLLCLVLGLAPDAHWRFRLAPASLSELELHAETSVLTRLNDVSHLGEVKHVG
jgi:broad specificity phosphatase PhoE